MTEHAKGLEHTRVGGADKVPVDGIHVEAQQLQGKDGALVAHVAVFVLREEREQSVRQGRGGSLFRIPLHHHVRPESHAFV